MSDIITVKVVKFGSDKGGVVELSGGGTVRDALQKLNLSADGCEIRVSNRMADLSTRLAENDEVILSRAVEGNART